MHTLAFDGRMGASGDMLLGALLDTGADAAVLTPVEEGLDVRYAVGRTTRNGIAAVTVDVKHAPDHAVGDTQPHSPVMDDGHDEDAGDDGGHGHEDSEAPDEGAPHHHGHGESAEGAGPTRTYPEVRTVVESMDLPSTVAGDAMAVFELLGEAEAAVHDTDLADTHFHEVGADDAIADIVGVCLLLADLDVAKVVTTPLAVGGGDVETSHGNYPVPAPAVVEVAERADWDVRGGPVEAELLTPTGAALLAHFAEGVDALPPLRLRSSGYGAGDATFPDHPNVMRALVGESRGELRHDDITVLETNVDDVSPEFLGGLQERLADAGARDVTVLPATMKKSRPGHLVQVIAKPEDSRRLARRLAEETGTLGVREARASHRWIARRRHVTATLSIEDERHPVAVKIASDESGEDYDLSAEFDEAAEVAADTGLSIRAVARRAEEAVRTGGGLAEVLVHLISSDDWAAVEGDIYEPPSLDEAGFVHLSPIERVPGVAQANFPGATNLRVLVIDRDAVDPEIKYEEMPSGSFPHAYGPLNMDAIVDVLDLPRDEGRFVIPPDLAQWT